MAMIWCCSYPLEALWMWRRGIYMLYHYAGWDMGQVLWAKTEMPIEWMASFQVTTKIKNSSDHHQCENYGDSHVRLWWCNLKAYHTSTAHQCGVHFLNATCDQHCEAATLVCKTYPSFCTTMLGCKLWCMCSIYPAPVTSIWFLSWRTYFVTFASELLQRFIRAVDHSIRTINRRDAANSFCFLFYLMTTMYCRGQRPSPSIDEWGMIWMIMMATWYLGTNVA